MKKIMPHNFVLRSAIRLVSGGLLFLLLIIITHSLQAQTVQENLYVTNGTVRTSTISGNTLYIGGEFTYVGPYTGRGALLNAGTGNVNPSIPKVNGSIYAVTSDGNGGWYIGGFFSSVGGIARSNIAHIKSDKTVDAGWDPNANNAVKTIAVSGSVVYVGGAFTSMGGQSRNRIAALDASTGNVTSWDPNSNNFTINTLTVSGQTIYAGGDFTSIGGQTRNKIAAIDASTGNATSWNPNASGEVKTIIVSGSVIYVGGYFASIGGQVRNSIAAIDASSGNATPWNPNLSESGSVYALAVSGSIVYVGGGFSSIGGQLRNCIAALDAATGNATSWNPNLFGGSVSALAISGSLVYVGGLFTNIGGQARNYIAALDAATGNATAWDPKPTLYVNAIAISGSDIFVGGEFTSIGGQARNRIAALDITTGSLTPWDPNATGGYNPSVRTILVSGPIVYVGGSFTTIGSQPRNCIAAVDGTTGLATSWNPNASKSTDPMIPTVTGLGVSGSVVYACGSFTSIGGQARNSIAALDATSGLATSWDPNANNNPSSLSPFVNKVIPIDSIVYVCGTFRTIGGQPRNNIAALNATTGLATFWNPNANSEVDFLILSGAIIYVRGTFTMIGGQLRNAIASLDVMTGNATSWNPNPDNIPYISAIAKSGSMIYASGIFLHIGGQARNFIAALDATTGNATPWNPSLDGIAYTITPAPSNATVYIGGRFTRISGNERPYLAALSPSDGTTPTISKTSGDNQPSQYIFTNLAQPFVITVIDGNGNPIPSANVTFSITASPINAIGQALGVTNTITDANGRASTTLKLGSKKGIYIVTATADGIAGNPTFTSYADPGLPTNFSIISGDNQTGTVGTQLANPFVVAATDSGGNYNGLASILPVAITSTPSGATGQRLDFADFFINTDPPRGGPKLTLGNKPGIYKVSVEFGYLGKTLTFTSTAIPRFILLSGNSQSGTAGAALGRPFIIKATDANDNPVSNVTITFAINSTPAGTSGQSLSVTNTTTNALGEASTTLTLGSKPGTYTVTATSQGLTGSPLTFTVTANPGPPAAIALSFGNNQQGAVNKNLDTPFGVIVTDAFGNRVPNASVGFTITGAPAGATGQSLDPPYILTDENGQATTILRLGNKVGAYTVKATAVGVDENQATFTANAIAGAPTTITTISGAGQSATIGSVLPNPFVVAVTDGGGNPVARANVTFAISLTPTGATGQALSAANTTTNTNGQGSAMLTLGNKAGAYTVTAASGSLSGSPLTFTSTALNPLPSLRSIAPASAGRGSKINVVLSGTNFVDGATTISFGADITVNTFTVISSSEIRANISVASTAANGGRAVNVTIAEPGGGTASLPTGFIVDASLPTNVEYDPSTIPRDYQLFDAYPNPFNPSTTIRFGLPEQSTVKLCIYNTLGKLVAELLNGEREAGQYSIRWSPRNIASGLYLIRLEAQSSISLRHYTSSRKVILLK